MQMVRLACHGGRFIRMKGVKKGIVEMKNDSPI